MLQYRDNAFPIFKIPNFWRMLVKINQRKDFDKLGQLSKVIAFLILDKSKKSFSKMFEERIPLKYSPSVKILDINEGVLVRAPELIENMVEYLRKN